MANQHNDVSVSPSHHSRIIKLVGASSLLLFVFLLSACSGNQAQASLVNASAALDARTAHASTATTYPIKVFFSRFPQSANDSTAVFPVDRVSPTIGVGTFAIQLLIAGPTTEEHNAGYFSELNSILSGASYCSAPFPTGGPDFTLTLNKKGNVPETGTATLRFCRATSSPGIGADARITTEINATLKQFSSIKKVVILTKDGHCFNNASGLDLCLR
jgi:hypothetical protein